MPLKLRRRPGGVGDSTAVQESSGGIASLPPPAPSRSRRLLQRLLRHCRPVAFSRQPHHHGFPPPVISHHHEEEEQHGGGGIGESHIYHDDDIDHPEHQQEEEVEEEEGAAAAAGAAEYWTYKSKGIDAEGLLAQNEPVSPTSLLWIMTTSSIHPPPI